MQAVSFRTTKITPHFLGCCIYILWWGRTHDQRGRSSQRRHQHRFTTCRVGGSAGGRNLLSNKNSWQSVFFFCNQESVYSFAVSWPLHIWNRLYTHTLAPHRDGRGSVSNGPCACIAFVVLTGSLTRLRGEYKYSIKTLGPHRGKCTKQSQTRLEPDDAFLNRYTPGARL